MAKTKAEKSETMPASETPKPNGNGAGPQTRPEAGTRAKIIRRVKLSGLLPIMFDRYPGDNDTKLEPWQKLNFMPGSRLIALPVVSIMSFLSAQNTDSAPKKLLDPRKYKRFCQACSSFVQIENIGTTHLPFLRDGKPIELGKLVGESDPLSGVYIDHDVARLKDGIPNPKVRPVLPLDWALEFTLTLFPNQDLQEQQLLNVFSQGGIAVGLGTNRPRYGKFEVVFWE
jgi:hypothetical protein